MENKEGYDKEQYDGREVPEMPDEPSQLKEHSEGKILQNLRGTQQGNGSNQEILPDNSGNIIDKESIPEFVVNKVPIDTEAVLSDIFNEGMENIKATESNTGDIFKNKIKMWQKLGNNSDIAENLDLEGWRKNIKNQFEITEDNYQEKNIHQNTKRNLETFNGFFGNKGFLGYPPGYFSSNKKKEKTEEK